ncbi:conserved unknown protein [Ectocarpus siliculosus]|uniref:Uncharacterized protein n=1 Tax=Ectocarpus siliculosus TaxID=2880 RepID=D7G8L5_ECTSI|nr:conserved unknown protein [Ectocarpus siliculosus]|eukprot:CBJ34047.1 conserved unknown protein [Ectocarpus siliculosus]
MVVFGGVVNGERVNELASFDVRTRGWRRLDSRESPGNAQGRTPPPIAMATVPAPRAYHVAWAFGNDVYVHGGEGPTGVRTDTDDPDLDGVFGSVGRDLFAEEDGGAPLDPVRVVRGAGAGKGAAASGHRVRRTGPSCGVERRPSVSVLEDLWKLDFRTLRWERLSSRLAPLGRKGHTASVVPLRDRPCVLIFGGAPAGRRGLSNALYSVDLAMLSAGEGTWERHKPSGTAPAPRHGHSLTAVAGGKRLVLFGGKAENGDRLGDIQILEVGGGGSLSWAVVQRPVGDLPPARHGHSACEVPTSAGVGARISRGAGVLVFGGEETANEGPEIRSTDSHKMFLYDPKESRWQAVETGHAFPIGRHGHSMSSIAGWTPPSFHPDGTLTASELAPPSTATAGCERNATGVTWAAAEKDRRVGGSSGTSAGGREPATRSTVAPPASSLPSEAGVLQWGEKAPTCAVIFGGLNSMYVSPEVWMLPLRWGERTVPFFSPKSEPEPNLQRGDGGAIGSGGDADRGKRELGMSTSGRLKGGVATAAATAQGRTAASADGGRRVQGVGGATVNKIGTGDGAWRLFQAGSTGVENARVKHRRASLPGGFAGFAFDANRSNGEQPIHEIGVAELAGVVTAGPGSDNNDHNGMAEATAEIEAELHRLRKIAYVSEKKLSAEVATRMHLEETIKEMREETNKLRFSKESSEIQLREESRRHWHEGQKAKVQCASLERLLAEAYELLNMVELQHHLQVKSLMPALYGDPRLNREIQDPGEQRGIDKNSLHGPGQWPPQHHQQPQHPLENGDGNHPGRAAEGRRSSAATAGNEATEDAAARQFGEVSGRGGVEATVAVRIAGVLGAGGPLVAV